MLMCLTFTLQVEVVLSPHPGLALLPAFPLPATTLTSPTYTLQVEVVGMHPHA